MATVELTKDNFKDITGRYRLALVKFGADWCPSSRAFTPVFESASGRHPDLLFGTVDTQVQKELGGAFEIRYIPTLVVIRDGDIVHNKSGGLEPQQLADLIRDMRPPAAARRQAAQPGVVLGGRNVRPW
jgi:thioredoxin 1